MGGDGGAARADSLGGRAVPGVAIGALGWLALSAGLFGLVSGSLLFLYYLSNFGIEPLFSALQGRLFDRLTLIGLGLSIVACLAGGALAFLAKRRGGRSAAARWALFLGLAGLLLPLAGVIMLVVWFLFWP